MTKLPDMFGSSFKPALFVEPVMTEILPTKSWVWRAGGVRLGLLPGEVISGDGRGASLGAPSLQPRHGLGLLLVLILTSTLKL